MALPRTPPSDQSKIQVGAGPMSAPRVKYFEELRKNHVPRYLFRAWSSASGGPVSINTIDEIVPPAFNGNRSAPSFYSMREDEAQAMAQNHYYGGHGPLSGFSSWAASLHLVLCYAEDKFRRNEIEVHVAVMDTQALEGEVLVWHVPQLLSIWGEHEYLAYGCIRGRGYKAVPYSAIVGKQLKSIFPEVESSSGDHFGVALRSNMFANKATPISDTDFKIVRKISSLFGGLFLPVATALLTIRPRYSPDESTSGENEGRLGDVKTVSNGLGLFLPVSTAPFNLRPHFWTDRFTSGQMEWGQNNARTVINGLGRPNLPPDLASQAWIIEPGRISTRGFPDVDQWIILLRIIASHTVVKDLDKSTVSDEQQTIEKDSIAARLKKRKRGESGGFTGKHGIAGPMTKKREAGKKSGAVVRSIKKGSHLTAKTLDNGSAPV